MCGSLLFWMMIELQKRYYITFFDNVRILFVSSNVKKSKTTGILYAKKSLKTPKWWSGALNQRGRDSPMTKKDKGTNNDIQNITQRTNDRVTGTPLSGG